MVQFDTSEQRLAALSTDCLAVGVFEDEGFVDSAQAVDAATRGLLARLKSAGDLPVRGNETLLLPAPAGLKARRLLVGQLLGVRDELGDDLDEAVAEPGHLHAVVPVDRPEGQRLLLGEIQALGDERLPGRLDLRPRQRDVRRGLGGGGKGGSGERERAEEDSGNRLHRVLPYSVPHTTQRKTSNFQSLIVLSLAMR